MTTPPEPSALPPWDQPPTHEPEPDVAAAAAAAAAPASFAAPADETVAGQLPATPSGSGSATAPGGSGLSTPSSLPPTTLPGIAAAGSAPGASAPYASAPPPFPTAPGVGAGGGPPLGTSAAGSTPPPFSQPPARGNRLGMLLLGGAGCVCLLLLACVGGLSLFGGGLLASLTGGGTPTPLFTVAPLSTAIALSTATSVALPTSRATLALPTTQSTAIVLPTTAATTVALPTARGTLGPIIRLTPSTLPTARGTQPAGAASLSAIKFSPGVMESDDSPIDALDTFPAGTNVIYAAFSYSGLNSGTPYRTEWLKNGQAQTDLQSSGTWKSTSAGNWWSSLTNPNGITAAVWQYNFYVNDKLATSGKVTVESAPAGQPNFTSIVFASDKDANDQPVSPADVTDPKLDSGISKLWAFFDGVNVPKGTPFSVQWFYNGKSYTDKVSYTWNLTPNENNYQDVYNTNGTPLQPGTYELKLWIGTRLVKVAAVILSAP